MARVQIVGLGRVGLPLAVVAARRGHEVRGVDTDPAVRAALARGEAPFREEGLAEALAGLALTVAAAPGAADVHVVAAPTPLGPGGAPDLSAVLGAVDALAPVLRAGDLVVLESTCPPGTAGRVAGRLRDRVPDLRVACATERVLPGRALEEVGALPRVVGGVDPASTEAAASFYASLTDAPVDATDARTAETVKLVENAFRDVNIAFANEVDALCREIGVDAREVIGLANRHPRVRVLDPGVGVGGHCLPVDPWFLVHGRRAGALVRAARAVNDGRAHEAVERVVALAGEGRVACLGLTYKPGSDDLRNAPALAVVEALCARLPGRVRAVDPLAAGRHPLAEADVEGVVAWADLVVALVAHPAFRGLDRERLAHARTLDLCGLWAERPVTD